MTCIEVFAPAKINLALHVTGQRADGYHLLDSLVAFAPVGDVLQLRPAAGLSLTLAGPESAGLTPGPDNLALRGAALVAAGQGAAIHLAKHLPVASGIGGGSADAAAAVRGMLALRGTEAPAGLGQDLLALGADLPMCRMNAPLRARGIGEVLEPLSLPPLPALLVNPRLPVATPAIFRALACRSNPPLPEALPVFAGPEPLIDWLAGQRNDLQPAACAVEPAILAVLDALRQLPGCRLARMSGSGATCFGLFDTEAEAGQAAQLLRAARSGWWIAPAVLGDQTQRATPRRQ